MIRWDAPLWQAWLLARPFGVAAFGFVGAYGLWCFAMQPDHELIRAGFDRDLNGARGFVMLMAAVLLVFGWAGARQAQRWFFKTRARRRWRMPLLVVVWIVGIYCAIVATASPDHGPHWWYRPATAAGRVFSGNDALRV